MAKKTAKQTKTSPINTHKFVAKKAYKRMDRTFGAYKDAGGVRALVVKSLPKGGATPVQVAHSVAKYRKGYSPQAALNCLRWLQAKGHVQRMH